jgi:DNA-binding winged helix-turn-helix (wHTH) protein
MLRFARGGPAVLVAVSDERRPEHIARALARVGLIPVLAFDEQELRAFMRATSFAGIVIDAAIDPEGAAVAPFAGRRDVVLLYLAREMHQPAPRHVHAVLPADIASLELASRVRALLELRATDMFDGELAWGGLQLDIRRRQARFNGDVVHLTPVQFRILAALVRAQGGVLTKDELQAEAWPLSVPDDGERLVAHIRRIRAKLEPDPSRPRFLLTARGEGFRLADCKGTWDGTERRVADRRRCDGQREEVTA